MIALAIIILLWADGTRESVLRFSETIFIATLVPALFFSLRLGRSNHFFTVLVLAGLAGAAALLVPATFSSATAQQRFYYHAAAVLAPLHFVLFAWWHERGLLNMWGLSRLIWIGLVPAAAAAACRVPDIIHHPGLARFVFHRALSGFPDVPLVPLIAALLALMLLLVMYLRDPSPARDGFFWATAIVSAGFLFQKGPVVLQLAASGAIVVLLVSMVETGHFFAYRDELTGLPSRRALNEKLQALGRTYTIAMVDVDHFKRFNDRYGHDVGDEVLKKVAAALKRAGGNAYRFGGEEFTLVFPGKALAQGKAAAEAARNAVSRSAFTIRSPARKKKDGSAPEKATPGKRKRVSVTVSIGLAQRSSRHTTPDAVIKAADRALYRAKKNGRNRTETAP
ncbi:diguanylate cyclase [Desulfosudis oleivorans Hxd3]|uniref:diguanylate cyclase n=2 Tax=Desulfosudis TaxID=2904716 RepID=A8ZSX1_DESOH|nr:diguanylate cyclase [Desulfosudis oleivorans Hxd3]